MGCRNVLSFLLIFLSVWFSGCKHRSSILLEREELFNLTFGKLEDQLDLFHINESPYQVQPSLWNHEGRFYISNGTSGKVMVFSSYGDLLALFYNPEKNPPPIQIPVEKGGVVSNRKLFPYAFNQIGKIAVTSNGTLYIEDKLPEERSVFEKELGVRLNNVILRFENGEYKGYLGQEGVGGTPLPFIERLQVTRKEEVVVICRTPTVWMVYWFSPDGALKYKLSFSLEDLPMPYEGKVYSNLDAILPSPVSPSLFFKVSYFKEGLDSQTGIRYGIELLGIKMFRFTLPEGGFKELFDVPENQTILRLKSSSDPVEMPLIYELIGILPDEQFLFLSGYGKDSRQLLI
ncbi:MAG: hypothetical protein N2442_00820, partial [Spirochaetes bacterium]|nr:hypothetical protein [Spirochaetota bacterium]